MFLCLLFALLGLYPPGEQWSYQGDRGPETWASLSPEFSDCAGKNQSPVDLVDAVDVELEPIAFSYQASGIEMTNNGHTIQVTTQDGSAITLDGRPFQLRQFHFHVPSENRINGIEYAMELHLVHVDADGNLAVVAVLFSLAEGDNALADLLGDLPQTGASRVLGPHFNPRRLLPSDRDYYRFNGSLTTPPCTEGVRWLVIKQSMPVDQERVQAFIHAIGHPNHRPIQPLHARKILK